METQPAVPQLAAHATPKNNTVVLEITYPEQSSRWWALATLLFFIPKALVLIPHFFVLYVLGFVAMIIVVVGQFAVLFTGRYPRSLFDFAVGLTRWQTRVNAFAIGLTDTYPPFTFK